MRFVPVSAIFIPILGTFLIGCTAIGPSGAGIRPPDAPQPPRPPIAGVQRTGPVGPPPVQGQGPPPSQGPGPAMSRGLSVVGDGAIMVDPDLAYVSSGVQTRAATAAEAQASNTQTMNAMIAKIRSLGIPERDIRTTGINLSPVFGRDGSGVTGYSAANSVRVTVREIRRAGEILDAVVREGANTIGGIQFALADEKPARRQAVEASVKDAQSRAEAIAAAANVRIVGIIEINDEASGGPSPTGVARAALMAEAGPVPVQPGQLSINARVRVVFDIR